MDAGGAGGGPGLGRLGQAGAGRGGSDMEEGAAVWPVGPWPCAARSAGCSVPARP